MTYDEAAEEAQRRWGEYATALPPGVGLKSEYSFWVDRPWADAPVMVGRGASWALALADADDRKRGAL